jgi:sterol desaturase/sphingolipid hydroxylase (fatty acid hydroxylase superfamily)
MPDIESLITRPLLELASVSSRAFFLYFLTYIVIAYVLFRRRSVTGSFLSYLFPRDIYASRAFLIDALYFFFVTALAYALAAWLGGLIPAMRAPFHAASPAEYIAISLLSLIVFDFVMFTTHYAQHKIPALWKFHSMHHAPERLHFMVAFRHHPVDMVLVTIVMTLVFAAVPQPETNVFIVAFYFAGYHFRHSHIPLDYPAWLKLLLISPSDHQAHHDKTRDARNLGFIFSFWDRLAGTYAGPHQEKYEEAA